MWITPHVNLPSALLDAQKQGRLVVFAGAGVSMSPPSNYPNFPQLADQIAQRTFISREENEPVDRFLGRLAQKGVAVHALTKTILTNPESRPNLLHADLLRLFGSVNNLRVVTTNFDDHLTASAEEVYQDQVDVFYAPALPLGHNFHGLVYLHGTVGRSPADMVLTDMDFGRAYVTEGWARRFLQGLFDQYVVLFVGYSHTDPVVDYLARGLPSSYEGQRFALVPEGAGVERWRFLGVTPVVYPSTERGVHAALGEAIAAWVDRGRMGALDHETRIQRITEGSPPLGADEADYIQSALDDPATTRFFTRHARDVEWLRWAEGQPAFRVLFQQTSGLGDAARMLAKWYAECFVCQYPAEAMGVLLRSRQVMHPELWSAIAHHLAYSDPQPAPTVVSQWVPLLLAAAPPWLQMGVLETLLHRFGNTLGRLSCILLFEHLTRPSISLEPSLLTGSSSVRPAIVFYCNDFWLRECWASIFVSDLTYYAARLEPVLASHVAHAYGLLRASRSPDDDWDPITHARPAIENHEQNQDRGPMDLVIDATRDVAEWLVRNEINQASALIDRYLRSGIPILQRIAVHGMAQNPHVDDDTKLSWVLRHDLLFDLSMRHEVFRLLKHSYPQASAMARSNLVVRAKQGPQDTDGIDLNEDWVQYQTYNLLYWLRQAAPECAFAEEGFSALQGAHPDFAPREHPDFNVYSYGFEVFESPSPVTVEQLLAHDARACLDDLLHFRLDDLSSHLESGLRGAIVSAVATSPSWASELVDALVNAENWTSDLWECILGGWNTTSATESHWETLLQAMLNHPALDPLSSSTASFLERALRDGQSQLSMNHLAIAERVADRVWDIIQVERDGDQHTIDVEDWLQRAINHPGGQIAEAWLYALSRRRQHAKDEWFGLPEDYRHRLEDIVLGNSMSALCARVVLTHHLNFLFALDQEWSVRAVVPLLDWSIDEARADQAWQGYLWRGRWNEALLPFLRPRLRELFARWTSMPAQYRDAACGFVASVCVQSSSNLLEDDWLYAFIAQVPEAERNTWVSYVRHRLASLNEAAKQAAWDNWIEPYWRDRLVGKPIPLQPSEVAAMIEWSLHLEPVMPALVDKICASPLPTEIPSSLFHDLRERGILDRQPGAIARLLRCLLLNAQGPAWWCQDAEDVVRSLRASDASREDLLCICDDLGRLGCPNAAELRSQLQSSLVHPRSARDPNKG